MNYKRSRYTKKKHRTKKESKRSRSIETETLKLLQSHLIPYEWGDEVAAEIPKIPYHIADAATQRVDLRQLPLITIDDEQAQDFDDAVYCRPTSNGWELTVAIADVSHYVGMDSAIDQEAQERATSIYFPHLVIPMLPEILSNDLCSLKPEKERLALAVTILIDKSGQLNSYQFYEALIYSHGRLTYTEIDLYSKQPSQSSARVLALSEHIDQLTDLYQCLQQARKLRGSMDLELATTSAILNEANQIERIVPIQRNLGHLLIEESMLAANCCAADMIQKSLCPPALYRNHLRPTEERLQALHSFLKIYDLTLTGDYCPSPRDFQILGDKAHSHPNRNLIYNCILRSQQQAIYTPSNGGHFGLAYTAYTHFTSPIRRYPDLVVHRAIRSLIHSQQSCSAVRRVNSSQQLPKTPSPPYSEKQLSHLGEHCSMAEKRAEKVSRDLLQWLKCQYLLPQVGQYFKGIITTVTSFGLFVELDSLQIDGLVHISNLGGDYYDFQADQFCLQGRSSGIRYQQGERIKVKVASIDQRKYQIQLCL